MYYEISILVLLLEVLRDLLRDVQDTTHFTRVNKHILYIFNITSSIQL